jgi:hypothetical protein
MPISSVRPRLSALCRNRLAQKCALGVLAAWSLGATSFAPDNFEEQFDDDTKKWAEIALQLPPAPQAKDLLPVYVGPTARQKFFIDANSVSVGSDGIVRYTLVSKSDSGAQNISYEGIRCQTYQKKQYAFGRDDGSWARSRQDRWRPITELVANRQDAALAKDYLCEGGTVASSAANMVRRIRNANPIPPARDYAPGRD